MKKLLLIAVILALAGLNQPAFAHEGEDHEATEQQHSHDSEGIHAQAADISDNASALKIMQDGISFMADALTTKQQDLFSDGPTMDKFHDISIHIDEAAKFIESNTVQTSKEKRTRLSSALKQLTKSVTEFHIATHDRNLSKSMAELKKSQGSLKLVEAALK